MLQVQGFGPVVGAEGIAPPSSCRWVRNAIAGADARNRGQSCTGGPRWPPLITTGAYFQQHRRISHPERPQTAAHTGVSGSIRGAPVRLFTKQNIDDLQHWIQKLNALH
jgi:hypothetical protein